MSPLEDLVVLDNTAAIVDRNNDVIDLKSWDLIARELINLRADWVEIQGPRIRLSSVVTSTADGDRVTDLQAIALTPNGQEIVKYRLSPRPSGSLSYELAAMISSAQLNGTTAEKVISEIATVVAAHDGYQFIHNIPPMSLHQANPMQRVIPSFAAFARNPISIDREFRTEKLIGDTRIRASARMFPEFKMCVIEAHSYSHNTFADPASFTFKRHCPESFFKGEKSIAAITAQLHLLTWEAFEVVTSEGPAEAHKRFYSADLDDRLSHGVINPVTAEKDLMLPSGARVRMEVGDTVACITTQALPSDESATFSWMILGRNGALNPLDSRLVTARVAVDKLAYGTTKEKLEAIATLDRMAHKAPTKLASLESIVGYEVADALRNLNNTVVKMGEPRSEVRMLDNLAGMQHVEFTFRDPGHNRKRPQDPWYMSLGFGCDGDLKIEAWNPLGNHMSTYVSPDGVDRHGGVERITLRLARLFDRQTDACFLQLRAALEDMTVSSAHSLIDRERLPSDARRMPSSRDIGGLRSYDVVAELAKLYQSVTGASFSELKVGRRLENGYEVEFSNVIGRKRTSLHCHVTQHGISRLELIHDNGGALEAEAFSYNPPLTLTAHVDQLRGAFEDFNNILPSDEDAASVPLPRITATRLFSRLKGLDDAETVAG